MVVTSPVEDEKMARYLNLGIDVIQVPVRTAEELEVPWPLRLFQQRLPGTPLEWVVKEMSQLSGHGNDTQGGSNRAIDELIDALIMCSPATRRPFAKPWSS